MSPRTGIIFLLENLQIASEIGRVAERLAGARLLHAQLNIYEPLIDGPDKSLRFSHFFHISDGLDNQFLTQSLLLSFPQLCDVDLVRNISDTNHINTPGSKSAYSTLIDYVDNQFRTQLRETKARLNLEFEKFQKTDAYKQQRIRKVQDSARQELQKYLIRYAELDDEFIRNTMDTLLIRDTMEQ
jgi:hypothetical protein